MIIQQSKPFLLRQDFSYINGIVKSGQIAGGELVEALQTKFSRFLNLPYAYATINGTAALHLALLAIGVKQGDEVILPSYTCTAVLNAVYYCGAVPVLADIDPETFNITPDIVKAKVSARTKAVIVTHTFGFPADMAGLVKFGIPLVEDCAHAIGALYEGKPVGSLGAISVFSLYATKMFASGEGGMVATRDKKAAYLIADLNNPDMRPSYKIRFNYKMSDLTAGLALSQFRRLDFFVRRRKLLAARYLKAFSKLPIKFQRGLNGTKANYYRFIVLTSRAGELIDFCRGRNIICDRPVFLPLHYYLRDFINCNFPGTDKVWKEAVSLPVYPALRDNEAAKVIATLKEGLRLCRKKALK